MGTSGTAKVLLSTESTESESVYDCFCESTANPISLLFSQPARTPWPIYSTLSSISVSLLLCNFPLSLRIFVPCVFPFLLILPLQLLMSLVLLLLLELLPSLELTFFLLRPTLYLNLSTTQD